MASLESAQTRALLAKGVVANIPSVAASVGIRLQYIGTGTVTSVVPTTATNLVLTTSDGGIDTYTFATTPGCDTMGGLVKAINNDGIFAARLLDVSGACATTSSQFKQNSAVAVVGGFYDLTIDGTTASEISAIITPDRLPAVNSSMRKGHRTHLQTIDTTQTFAGGALSIGIYERDILTQVETLLGTYLGSASTVAKAISFASGQGKITSSDGAEILVRTTGGTTLSVATLTIVGIAE
jgi:hypothetical protein